MFNVSISNVTIKSPPFKFTTLHNHLIRLILILLILTGPKYFLVLKTLSEESSNIILVVDAVLGIFANISL